MMCEIVLDMEIIGFDFEFGDCIVEIGCVELNNYMLMGEIYYVYINFECMMFEEVFGVYGIGLDLLEFLCDLESG